MAYYFTKVPTQWSPSTHYELANGIFLKPATRIAITDYPGHGATMFFDTMFFITSSVTPEEHVAKLRNWLLYHAVIFNDQHICHFFESGRLQEHYQVNALEEIQAKGDNNAYGHDFDDIGKQIYWMHTPPTRMSYKSLFVEYERLGEDRRALITAFLLTIETAPRNIQYSLFHDTRKYWQVVNYAAILEAIIGHPPNCPASEVKACCTECRKELLPHRKGSERQWRKQFLSLLGIDEHIQEQYLKVINAAYDEIRHKTAHPSIMPTPHYPMIVGTQEYDLKKSIKELATDTFALDSLVWLIRDVTRYLLLHHVFSLNFFPRMLTMKATHIGGQ